MSSSGKEPDQIDKERREKIYRDICDQYQDSDIEGDHNSK
jgi:hypothetical protein